MAKDNPLQSWFKRTLDAKTSETASQFVTALGYGAESARQSAAGLPRVSDIIDPDYVRKRSKRARDKQLREIERGTASAYSAAAASGLAASGSIADVISDYDFSGREDVELQYQDALAKAKSDEELVAGQKRDRAEAARRGRNAALGTAVGAFYGGRAGAAVGGYIGGKLGF